MNREKLQKEADRLYTSLEKLDPKTKEYASVQTRYFKVLDKITQEDDRLLKIDAEKQARENKRLDSEHRIDLENKEFELKAELERLKTAHKIELEKLEFEHKADIEQREFDHKVEMDHYDFELRQDESLRNTSAKEAEISGKRFDFLKKFICDLGIAGISHELGLRTIARLYQFESDGLVLPSRFMQFVNSLGKFTKSN